jgi:hypothetical protein
VNFRLVVCPLAIVVSFDQLPPYAVTVCLLHIDFHTTVVPLATETEPGTKRALLAHATPLAWMSVEA